MKKILPPIDKLIVKIVVQEITTKSGIVLGGSTNAVEENPHDILTGKVVAVGKDAKFVKIGNIILFEQCFSRVCNLGMVMEVEDDFKIVREQDMLGVLE